MIEHSNIQTAHSRRTFLGQSALGFGSIAAAHLMQQESQASSTGSLSALHHVAKAKRVIYLFQSGAPSQLDLFDHKPLLNEKHGTELPDEVRGGQRLTGMSGNQSSLPLAGSPFKFARHGESGGSFSELLPHTAGVADDLCVIRSMHTEAINHGPGVTFLQTGSMFPGRPSLGAWLDYGLGSENEDLPSFVVMVTKNKHGQPLVSRLWGSGFLPSRHQGVRFRSGKDPVLYLSNPDGINEDSRRATMDALSQLHQRRFQQTADPHLQNRIAQYELAFRMQSSIPDATDFSDEPARVFEEYGPDAKQPGSFAANCLLARRLAERGVRFIQLYHPGWDQHGGLPTGLPRQCRETDQASAALIADLKRTGLLEDTLVIWGGEFGRTNYCQGKLTAKSFGRDHHPRCFSIWMAGAGVQGGMVYGQTDPYGYNIVEKPVHVHDLQATILHLLGVDHERLTFKYQGRQFRLTDVHGHVVHDVLA
tara:strand:+ start:9968 stop:11401 length:1434 start_codon:yes stop_codon:yes gene_type:complete